MTNVIDEIKEKIEEGEEFVEEIIEKGEEKIGIKEPDKKQEEIKNKPEEPKPVEKPKKEEKPEEAKKEEVKEKPKEVVKITEKPKKTEAVVRGENIPISTKYSTAICRFIKNKRIEDALSDLEQVMRLKKAIPMKGEIPHRKGKGIMSGKFPQRAVSRFIILLKSLAANSNHNGLENPLITEAVANIGERPYGRFGRVRKKRSHIIITAKNKKIKEAKSKKRNADEDTSRVKKTGEKK